MSDDRKTDEEKFAKIVRDFGQRGARDRRERIATAVLAGIAAQLDANGCALHSVSDADVRYSIQVADMLIQELDKEGGR